MGVVCRVHHQPLQWCSDGPVLGSLWSYLPRLPCLPHTALLLGAIPLHIPKQQWKPLSILQQVTVSWRHSFLSQTMHHTNNVKNITQPQGKVEAESIFLWTTSQTISDDNLISVISVSSEFQDNKENFDLWTAFFKINLFKWQKAFTVKADEESFQQHNWLFVNLNLF